METVTISREEYEALQLKAEILNNVKESLLIAKNDGLTTCVMMRTLLDETNIELTLYPETGMFKFW